MEILGLLIYVCIIVLYANKILSYYAAWQKHRQPENADSAENSMFFSVIVAFRNEEKNLAKLIYALKAQKYNHFEVILVNDHSEDNGENICQQLIINDNRFSCIQLPLQMTGKKKAVAFGVENAKYQYIITTDADCTMNENWLEAINQCIQKTKAEMVLSPVFLSGQSYFQKLQALEFFSLMASTAAATLKQKPIMANAANMAFTKALYQQNSEIQNQKFMSGDDMMLLISAKKQHKQIAFCKDKNATVSTTAQENALNFIKQRMRWTSKSKFYKDFDINSTALIVLAVNILLLFSFLLIFMQINFATLYIFAFAGKSIVDLIFLKPIALHYNFRIKILDFLLIQLFYPFYVFLSALGIFFKPSWKGRNI